MTYRALGAFIVRWRKLSQPLVGIRSSVNVQQWQSALRKRRLTLFVQTNVKSLLCLVFRCDVNNKHTCFKTILSELDYLFLSKTRAGNTFTYISTRAACKVHAVSGSLVKRILHATINVLKDKIAISNFSCTDAGRAVSCDVVVYGRSAVSLWHCDTLIKELAHLWLRRM